MNPNETPEKPRAIHKILIVDNNASLGQRMMALLAASGYIPTRMDSFYGALAAIEKENQEPFSVVIACFELEKMSGDELLKNVKELAPDTQRVLVIESMEINSIISGVNRAGIHSCLTVPFRDELFLAEISQRCDQFKRHKERNRLLKITKYQNKQLYQMAIKLKKKNEHFTRQLQKKRALLETLDTRKKECQETSEQISLSNLLTLKGIQISPKPLCNEFKSLAFKLKCFLEEHALEGAVHLSSIDEILSEHFTPSSSQWLDGQTYTASTLQPMAEGDSALKDEGSSSLIPSADPKLSKILSRESGLDLPFVDQILHLYLEHEYNISQRYSKPTATDNEGKIETPDHVSQFHIKISSDHLSAWIHYTAIQKVFNSYEALQQIKSLIEERQIQFGIVEEEVIEEWLTHLAKDVSPLCIAKGVNPTFPIPEEIQYHFNVNYRQAGTIKPDGTIDFRERGRIPYVKAGALLAEKRPLKPGASGRDIFGNTIPVEQPMEQLFAVGTNAQLSEDQLKIFATEEGQPFLNAMGEIAVYQELSISGDVDYETGNIDFDGNLIVAGTIKEGFSVKCANLTANQIHGGEINVSGNLNISSGIVDSRIVNVQGHIQAKYVNNSDIKVFGDMIVQREIIDSHIFSGGELVNESGSIFSSTISAKKGICAGNVGSDKSAPISIEVGTERLMQMIQDEIDRVIKENNRQLKKEENNIEQLEQKDRQLLEQITDFAYVQEQIQDSIKRPRPTTDEASSITTRSLKKGILPSSTLSPQQQIQAIEEKISTAFEAQEKVLHHIQEHREIIEKLENTNKLKVNQKRALREFAARSAPKASLTVSRTIVAGTKIKGKQSSLILTKDQRYCRIHEVVKNRDNGQLPEYEMIISSK